MSHEVGKVTVIPFRRIIRIQENRRDRLFFLEARESEKKYYLSFNTFHNHLMMVNESIVINSKSVKKLKSEEIIAVKAVFEKFKVSQ